jgi:serine/threonine-protein kinase
MEFLEGETLAQHLKKGPMPAKEVRGIARQLTLGLAEAHRNHVVHGDLKSGNVILTAGPEGTVRAVITDFGLARQPDAGQTTVQTGERGGTPDYMAPELWKGDAATPGSDVYAMGVILYEMVAGHRPHMRESSWEERLTRNAPAVDSSWDKVLQRCLAPDPAQRLADGEELAKALEPPVSRRWLLASAGVAAVALITTVAVSMNARGPKESWRLALLPVEPAGAAISGNLEKSLQGLSGGSVARFSMVEAGGNATHTLRVSMTPHDAQQTVSAVLANTRAGTSNTWTAEYSPEQLRYAPAAITGFVTQTMHLPPAGPAPAVQAAARADYFAGLSAVRRDTGVDAALASFGRAVRTDSDSPLTWAGLGEAQWFKYFLTREREWLTRATESVRQAELRNPDVAAVHKIAGILQRNSGKYEAAEAEFRRALEMDANDGDTWRRLGQVLESSNHLSDAQAAFEKATALEPDYYRNHQALGAFYYQRGRFGEAAGQFEKTIALAGSEPAAHYALGLAYAELGRRTDAERELHLAIDLGDSAPALNELGVMLTDDGRPQAAIPYLTRALAHNPDEYLWWKNLGTANLLANHPVEAREAFRRGLELVERQIARDPRNGRVRSRLAYLAARTNDPGRAESEVTQALQMWPDDTETRFSAVNTYEALGEREKALAVLAGSSKEVLASAARSFELTSLQQDAGFRQMMANRIK